MHKHTRRNPSTFVPVGRLWRQWIRSNYSINSLAAQLVLQITSALLILGEVLTFTRELHKNVWYSSVSKCHLAVVREHRIIRRGDTHDFPPKWLASFDSWIEINGINSFGINCPCTIFCKLISSLIPPDSMFDSRGFTYGIKKHFF